MNQSDGSERKKSARRSVEPPPRERVELLMEQVLDHVKVIGEGHSVLRKELGEFRAEVDQRFRQQDEKVNFATRELSREIGTVARGLEELKGDVKELKGDVRRLDEKIDAVARDLKEHRADTSAHIAIH